MLPAVGQAALGLEVRKDDFKIAEMVSTLNHPSSMAAVQAERELLRSLRGGCLVPVAALATVTGNRILLRACVLSTDGKERVSMELEGPLSDPRELGCTVARLLQRQGADKWIIEGRRPSIE